MKCPRCGKEHVEEARFCQYCGLSLSDGKTGVFSPEPRYAGFRRRFLAIIIDELILAAVAVFFSVSYLLTIMSSPDLETVKITFLSNKIFSIVLHWLYFTIMESSSYQATLGKMAIGIKVTDYDGRRISFFRANGRYFGKFLSMLIFGIGFLMAGFTRKKQALHDMLAGTLVVMKPRDQLDIPTDTTVDSTQREATE
ncbi:MAG TPA: RDD family protein [Geobacteraceae bacterium]|nr:RDD family protein [Geobacteraceae bacterium]